MINISISKMLKLDYRTSEAYKTLRAGTLSSAARTSK